ncbi:MAG: methyltransferase domain-containing protein [Deltaproteobacteria bacterium]|nr:MAG: methyltransferase domain-containing protein [Deltaproteobacteria bacterium]
MTGRLTTMDVLGLKRHIQNYYKALYDGEISCQVPILSGKDLAGSLGYPLELLHFIPDTGWDEFFPCGNPLPFLSPSSGEWVLNLGCGAGIDSLALLATCSIPLNVVSMDIVMGILEKASRAASRCLPPHLSLPNRTLHWVCADGTDLPFVPHRFDWIIMNGVFNLFSDKAALLTELFRVLRPSGHLVVADLCSKTELPDYFTNEWDSWAWCMSGACTEERLSMLVKRGGFEQSRMIRENPDDLFYRVVFSCRKAKV